jgi:hypothetical protein
MAEDGAAIARNDVPKRRFSFLPNSRGGETPHGKSVKMVMTYTIRRKEA